MEVDALQEQLRRLQADSARSSDRLDELERRNKELESALEKLRTAALVLHNMGIFGNIYSVHRQGIDRIIDPKAENPGMLQEEAAAILHQGKNNIVAARGLSCLQRLLQRVPVGLGLLKSRT